MSRRFAEIMCLSATDTYETYAPHRFLRALFDYAPDLSAGRQNDAQECLSTLFCATGMHGRLCPNVASVQHEGVVLCELSADARISARAAPIDFDRILVESLTGDRAIAAPPELLAVRVENIYEEGGGAYFVDARVTWPAAALDLAPCLAEVTGAAVDVHYNLRGFVAIQH